MQNLITDSFLKSISLSNKRGIKLSSKERDAYLRRIVNSNMIGIFFWDTEGKITYANKAYLDIIGYTEEDLYEGRLNWKEITPIEYRDLDQQRLEELLETGITNPKEKEYIRKDGTRVPILIGGAFIEGYDDKGVSFVLDITNQRKILSDLKEREELYRKLVDYNPIGIIECKLDGSITYANPAFLEMLGYDHEDLENGLLNWRDITPDKYRDSDAAVIDDLKTKKFIPPFEKEYIRKDGTLIRVLIGVTFADETNTKCICFIEDITERKQYEEDLKNSEEKFRALIENSYEGIALIAEDCVITYASPSTERILGHKSDALVGKVGFDFLHPDDVNDAKDVINKVRQKQSRVIRREYRAIHANGSIMWLEVLFRNELGRPFLKSIVVNYRDITKRKEYEEGLKELHDVLETRVTERTHEIGKAIDELQSEVTIRRNTEAELQKINDQLQAVLDAVPACVSWFNSDLRYQGINKYLANMFSLDSEEVIGKEIGFLERSQGFGQFVKEFFDSNENKSSKEIKLIVGGFKRSFLMVAQKYYQDQFAVFVGLDITDRKNAEEELQLINEELELKVEERTKELKDINDQLQAEIIDRKKTQKELKKSRDQLEVIFQGVGDGITVQGTNGELIFANEAAAKALGFDTIDELLSAGVKKIVQKYEMYDEFGNIFPLSRLPGRLALQGKPSSEAVIKFKFINSNEERWAIVKATPIFDEQGSVLYAVNIFHDITERRTHEEKIYELAFHDQLTGTPNRVLFNQRLEQSLEIAKQDSHNIAVLFIDLDKFKNINDTLGHDAGDMVLKEVSTRIKSVLRKTDTVSRLGGDEFAIILPHLLSRIDSITVAEKIIESLSVPFLIKENEVLITPSIGISVFPIDSQEKDSLIMFADMAMYEAKKQGGNVYQFYDPAMREIYLEKVALEKELRKAIKQNELVVYYEPKVDFKTEKIIGMESLVRWVSPKRGLIPPMRFIPLAEETGLIQEIDKFVLEESCKQTKKWHDMGWKDLCISVNISFQDLNEDFIIHLKKVLNETGFNPHNLELELTERELMQNYEGFVNILKDIESLGISVSIDDFGTGYSSLSRIANLPINALKIDQSFVRRINKTKNDNAIIEAIIAIGKSLNMKIIAEGVETKDEFEYLKQNGCDLYQGYLMSGCIPQDDFENLVRKVNGD